MPRAPNFLKALEKGYLRTIELKGADVVKKPESHKNWMILNGVVYHVTGTATQVFIETADQNTFLILHTEAAAAVSGGYSLFAANADASVIQTQWAPIILPGDSDLQLRILGDATLIVRFIVLEWDA